MSLYRYLTVKELIDRPTQDSVVVISGVVKKVQRPDGTFVTLKLHDDSCRDSLRVVVEPNHSDRPVDRNKLRPGSELTVKGLVSVKNNYVVLQALTVAVTGQESVFPFGRQRKAT